MRTALLLAFVVGCGGGGSLKHAGDTCSTSSECDPGLLCDTGATPHVCAANGTGGDPPPDADTTPVDGRPIDARPIDARPLDAPPDAPPDAAPDAV